MIANAKDITGQRFGALVVLHREGTKVYPAGNRAAIWRCRCDCGREVLRIGFSIRQEVKQGRRPSCDECFTGRLRQSMARIAHERWHVVGAHREQRK